MEQNNKVNVMDQLRIQLQAKLIKGKAGEEASQELMRQKLAKIKDEQEKSNNVYGFKRQLLGTPTSNLMMNAICIKGADVKNFDKLYSMMKKRK